MPAPNSNQVVGTMTVVHEGAFHPVKDRRLVPLVDDVDRREQHACADVEAPRQEEVEIGLFELELTMFFESLDERVLELELPDEADALRKAVVDQQHEAVKIELRVDLLDIVEMEVHVAGNRSGGRVGLGGDLGWPNAQKRRNCQGADQYRPIKFHILMSRNCNRGLTPPVAFSWAF